MNRNTMNKKMLRSQRTAIVLLLATILSLSVLLFTPSASAQQASEVTLNLPKNGTVWALIIGISDYGSVTDNLNGGSINGAKMISSMLTDTYEWPKDHIYLLLDEEGKSNDTVTKKEIKDAINWLAKNENQSDKVLFYFSGHGSRSDSGEPEYIVPHGARYYSEAVSDDELAGANMFSQIESSRTIVILDTCYSGGFAWDGSKPGDLAKDGRIVIASCREDESSIEIRYRGETEWKELFTTHLVKSLNNRTTVEQAFTQAQNETTNIAAQLKVEQHPQIYDGINFLPTDLNRDGEVNLTDTAIVTAAFRSRRGSAKWNPLSDIDKNGAIDMKDIALVARDFGSHIDI